MTTETRYYLTALFPGNDQQMYWNGNHWTYDEEDVLKFLNKEDAGSQFETAFKNVSINAKCDIRSAPFYSTHANNNLYRPPTQFHLAISAIFRNSSVKVWWSAGGWSVSKEHVIIFNNRTDAEKHYKRIPSAYTNPVESWCIEDMPIEPKQMNWDEQEGLLNALLILRDSVVIMTARKKGIPSKEDIKQYAYDNITTNTRSRTSYKHTIEYIDKILDIF